MHSASAVRALRLL